MQQPPLFRHTDFTVGIASAAVVIVLGMILQYRLDKKHRECVVKCVVACPAESPEACRAACQGQ